MSSLALDTSPNFIFGGKKPEQKDPTRFYACELKWNTWECRRTQEKNWSAKPDTLVTQLVPVSNWVPEFFDPAVVSLKLRKPVLFKSSS